MSYPEFVSGVLFSLGEGCTVATNGGHGKPGGPPAIYLW